VFRVANTCAAAAIRVERAKVLLVTALTMAFESFCASANEAAGTMAATFIALTDTTTVSLAIWAKGQLVTTWTAQAKLVACALEAPSATATGATTVTTTPQATKARRTFLILEGYEQFTIAVHNYA
jgi:hypothetical protein